MAQLGQGLGMKTLAEGVETSSQLQLLRAEGVAEAQGYLFGKAVPALEAEAMIDRQCFRSIASLATSTRSAGKLGN
jgi:EAL domain-containing protein (putative c-di-GMP-specific phosphodiesterase class I)